MRAACHPAASSPVLCLMLVAALAQPVAAQDSWNPFRQWPEKPARTAPARPPQDDTAVRAGEAAPDRANVQSEPRFEPRGRPVERSELAPIMAPDTSGLPLELWRGLDMKSLEELLAQLELPPRSPVLHQLWRRMLLSSATAPLNAPSPDHFLALRLEALYRSGLLDEMMQAGKDGSGPLVQALLARRDIGAGQREAGCKAIAALAAPSSGLPGRLKGEIQLLAGYCAAAAGDAAAASLAADLAREEGVEADLPLAVLAGVAHGTKPRLALPKRVLLLDYRFLELMGPVDAAQILDKAEPALLAALAGDANTNSRVQIAAAEAALRFNAVSPEAVAQVYSRQVFSSSDAADPGGQKVDPLLRRALFYRAVESARTPVQQTRMARALLDNARRAGAYVQTARLLAPLLANLQPAPDLDWFAESAVEMQLVAGQFDRARRWAEAPGGPRHWLALIDIADPERRGGRLPSLAPLEDLAARGRLGAESLHRLATVLDALDIDVPIGLWDAASRTPQPSTGYLPETGILADLGQSAKRSEAGRTVLLVMRTLGPTGPEGANVLAVGDAVRALKRIGLEADARRLGLEALLPAWPRTSAN